MMAKAWKWTIGVISASLLSVTMSACSSVTQTDGQPCETPGARGVSVTGKDMQCHYVANDDSKWAGRVFGVFCVDQSVLPTMDCTKETHLEWRYTGVYQVSTPPYKL